MIRLGNPPVAYLFVAPWIVESWHEAVSRLSFDLPTVRLDPYQTHVALAVAALLLLAFTWRAVGWLPVPARHTARALTACVMMVPLGAFVVRHAEGLHAFLHAPAVSQSTEVAAAAETVAPVVPVAPVILPAAVPAPPPPISPSAPSITARAFERVTAGMKKILTRPAGGDAMAVLFGTDRAREAGIGQLRFSGERGSDLTLGRALVAIPRAFQARDRERPWAQSRAALKAAPNEAAPAADDTRLVIHEIAALPRDAFLQAAALRLARSQRFKDHALVFVHGFDTTFEAAVLRAAQIAYDLHFDGAPFVYSWPSAGAAGRYGDDREMVRGSEPALLAFLNLIARETGAKSISVISHGLGAEPVLAALVALGRNLPPGVAVKEVVLSAPDVERAVFISQARELAPTVGRITLYAASSDRGLNITRRYRGGIPRAGESPEGGPIVIDGIDTVDASAPGTDLFGRNNALPLGAGPLMANLAARLGVPAAGAEGALERVVSNGGGAYWRFPASSAVAH